jgi:sec-independent protein translocase protein TatC
MLSLPGGPAAPPKRTGTRMSPRDQTPDPDDFFQDTRMSFGEHIEDLRTHLWRAIKGFFIAVFFSFFIGKSVLAFIAAPVEAQLAEFYERRVQKVEEDLQANNPDLVEKNRLMPEQRLIPREEFERLFGVKVNPKQLVTLPETELARQPNPPLLPGIGAHLAAVAAGGKREFVVQTTYYRPLDTAIRDIPAQKVVGRRPVLSTLNVQEAFVVYIKVCLVTGFVLASPWVFYQIWSFIAAGLYPHEKRYVNVFLPFSLGLFLLGVAVCEFLVMPKAVEALLWFNEWLGLEPDLRLNEWLGFAIWMPVVFGLSFQTPLVMLFLERVGTLTVDSFRGKRRVVWFLMAVFAAVITPSTDAFSMLFLWVPMCLLYELGIGLILLSPRQPPLDLEVPEPEDMVEV